MSLKILASLIILIAVVAHATNTPTAHRGKQGKEFWARERKGQLRPQKSL